MYIVTNIDFDYWCRITFENNKGKEFKIECSNDFGEKFIVKYINFKNPKYKVAVSYIDSKQTFLFKKKFSLLRLYWLKFRGFLSSAIEEMFI